MTTHYLRFSEKLGTKVTQVRTMCGLSGLGLDTTTSLQEVTCGNCLRLLKKRGIVAGIDTKIKDLQQKYG